MLNKVKDMITPDDENRLRDENGQFTEEGAKKFGQEGGEATSREHGEEFYSQIGQEGADKRWGKKKGSSKKA